MLKGRLSKLKRFFENRDTDAILINNSFSLNYLSNFTGGEGWLLISKKENFLICDSRYTTQAEEEAKAFTVVEYKVLADTISAIAAKNDIKTIYVEGDSIYLNQFNDLASKVKDVEFKPLETPLSEIRAVKDKKEIKILKSAAKLASQSLIEILPLLKSGVKELDFALSLEFEMRRRGADALAFDIIVASGERGAMPHGVASSKVIRQNEMVTIDFGCIMGGYNSDETVTIAVGEPDKKLLEIYQIVKDAQSLAIDSVKAGRSCREIDAVARDYIAKKGYGDFFGHGLGHGVGLEIHEKPQLSPRSDGTLEASMVVTVEPGIYIPKLGGVRIEDTIVVTEDGCEVITQVPKELIKI